MFLASPKFYITTRTSRNCEIVYFFVPILSPYSVENIIREIKTYGFQEQRLRYPVVKQSSQGYSLCVYSLRKLIVVPSRLYNFQMFVCGYYLFFCKKFLSPAYKTQHLISLFSRSLVVTNRIIRTNKEMFLVSLHVRFLLWVWQVFSEVRSP